MQELLRHASSRVTMDTYTQAVTSAKRLAQSAVVCLFHKQSEGPAAPDAAQATNSANPLPLVPFCAYDETRSLILLLNFDRPESRDGHIIFIRKGVST